MGIQDRDYYRESTTGWWSRFGERPATVSLMILIGGTFLLQLVSYSPQKPGDLVTSFGDFYLPALLNGQVWRLLTPTFLHGGIWSVAVSLYFLHVFGREIEAIYGPREFPAFYLTSGLIIGLAKLALGLLDLVPAEARSIGANGPILALVALYACHYPFHRIYFFGVLPIPAWGWALGSLVLDFGHHLGSGAPLVGYGAHLLGVAFALAYFQFHLRVLAWLPQFSSRRSRSRPAVKLFTPEPRIDAVDPISDHETPTPPTKPKPEVEAHDEHLEAKVDAVLEKVSRFGRGGLTADERQLLERASEIYKRRRSR